MNRKYKICIYWQHFFSNWHLIAIYAMLKICAQPQRRQTKQKSRKFQKKCEMLTSCLNHYSTLSLSRLLSLSTPGIALGLTLLFLQHLQQLRESTFVRGVFNCESICTTIYMCLWSLRKDLRNHIS